MASEHQAFVTLATDDSYGMGAFVLGHSLRRVKTTRSLVVLISSKISQHLRLQLRNVFDVVKEVNLVESGDVANLALIKRPELGVTFTKLQCWTLVQFSKCVFLDADTLVLKNCDELFQREELSAVADVGWPDCFNSGVFVYQPSDERYKELMKLATEKGSFDGGDQGLLNTFFSNWATKDISYHLPFIYNMNTSIGYTYMPAYRQYGKEVKIVHFLGTVKPWMYNYNEATGKVDPYKDSHHMLQHVQLWWDIFMANIKPETPEEKHITSEMARVNIERSYQTEDTDGRPLNSFARQCAWELGQIDYLGEDSFDNIQRKLDDAINGNTK